MELSQLAQELGGSAIRKMFNAALLIEDTIKFTVGEPDFMTPKAIRDDTCKWWQKGLTKYTENTGVGELRQAIAEYHADDLKPDPDSEILVTFGATEGIETALFALVDPGDEVLLVTPAWPNYFGQIRMCGGVLVPVVAKEENGFVPDPEDIERAVTEKSKVLIINSPSNPTGAVIDRERMEAIAKIACEHDLFVIADEVYSRLIYTDEPYCSITEFEGMKERTVYCNSFAKMFAMTGWKIGYAIAAPEIVRAMTKIHENGVSCLPAPGQLSAAFALRNCQADVELMRQSFRRRRDLICALIDKTPGMSIVKPEGAFYAFANIRELCRRSGMDTDDFCMDLLKSTGVVIVPGSGFGAGGEGYVRITYAASDENIQKGFERIGAYITRKGLC